MDSYKLKQLQRMAALASIPYSRRSKLELYRTLLQEGLLFDPHTRVTLIRDGLPPAAEVHDLPFTIDLSLQTATNSTDDLLRVYQRNNQRATLDSRHLYIIDVDHHLHRCSLSDGGSTLVPTPPLKALLRSISTLYLLSLQGRLYSTSVHNIPAMIQNYLPIEHALMIGPDPNQSILTELKWNLLGEEQPIVALDGDDQGMVFLTEQGELHHWSMSWAVYIDHGISSFKYRYGLLGYLKEGRLHLEGRNIAGMVVEDHHLPHSTQRRVVEAGQGCTVVAFDFGIYHRIYLDNYGRVFGWGTGLNGELVVGSVRTFDKPTRIPLNKPITALRCGPTTTILYGQNSMIHCSDPTLVQYLGHPSLLLWEGTTRVVVESL